MTPAEKQRRYRERKFGNKPPVTKVSAARIAQLEDQIERMATRGVYAPSMLAEKNELQTRARELEAEVARLAAETAELKARTAKPAPTPLPHPKTPEEWQAVKRQVSEQRAAERARPEAKIAALEKQLEQKDRRIAKLESESALQQEIASVRRQLREARASLRRVANKNTVLIPKADLRIIRACLHPDRAPTPEMRQQYENAFKAFNTLKIEDM